MAPMRKFFSAIGRDWLARMSGPLTVPFALAALFLPSAAAKILFAVLAIVAALLTCYRIWKSEYDRAESLEGQLSASDKQSAITSKDWKELADRFKEIGRDVSAQWQCNRGNDQTISEDWNFSGQYQKPCESLCKFAGALLLKSPNICPTLSHSALRQLNPAWRWLFFLKETHRATDLGGGMALAGGDGTNYFSERISNLAAVSARVCMECAALEL